MRSIVYILLVAQASCAACFAADAAPSFTRDIKGILSNRCVRCHGPDSEGRAGGGDEGLRLDTFEGATADLGGHAAIVPGKPDESELIARITSTDPDIVMPPPEAGERLPEKQVDLLKRWIAAGATYEPHWAYVPPKRPPVPAVTHTAWPKNDIDRFILARLEAEGLSPQPEADRATLARRLALDLTGLPPPPAEVDAFVADASADAVEKLVDRLLSHDGYGEHMARQWLDLARYADSAGYVDDPPRTIWGWRDWVVRAFDANMPFDEFTLRQIAGDLLPNPTLDDRVATAFHRNTLTNNEGGTIDEEFRTVAIIGRVNTTMSGAKPGESSLANNCLLARRLVEEGVRFVHLFDWGWDFHGNLPNEDIRDGLTKKAATFDRPAAALIEDLEARGLLDDTLVLCTGEFGRTPFREGRTAASGILGRDHYPDCYSIWMAGGGVKAGHVHGASDDLGFKIARDMVHIHDLQATILHLLGFDHTKLTYRFQGRDFRLTDAHGHVVQALLS
jgi:hypothetical protein